MDFFGENQEEESLDIQENYDALNAFGIEFHTEKELWQTCLIKKYTYPPNRCPCYFNDDFILKEKIVEDLLNPYYLRCGNKKGKSKNLRYYSFF